MRILGKAPCQQFCEIGIHVGPELGQRNRLFPQARHDQVGARAPLIRSLERKKLIAYDAQGVHIRFIRDPLTEQLFGTQVPGIAKQLSSLCKMRNRVGARLQDTYEPKVHEHDSVRVLLTNDILRLHIAVDDSVLVRGRQRRGKLAQRMRRLLQSHDSLCLERICEVAPFDVLHDDERRLVLEGADPIHGRHVAMVDLRGGSSFPGESLPGGLILGHVRLHDLDRDQTLKGLLPGKVHVRHGTLTQ